MNIYYAMTKFHLIFSITHKLVFHRDENAILFLYSGLQDIETNYDRLKEIQIFSDVFIVPEIELRRGWKILNDTSPIKEIEENIKKLADEVERWLPIEISRGDELYIANDHWAIGTYCIYHGISYTYYEDGVGMLSKPEYSYELVRKMNVTHAIIAKHMGAFGQNQYVKKKIADLNNQNDGFQDELAEHFSLKEQLQILPVDDMKKLLYVFNAPQITGNHGGTILLTEHFINMKRLTIQEHKELYAMLVDFFHKGNCLYIKPHPNDFQVNYLSFLGEANIISRKFPSELLPYCFNMQMDLALAACSTSVYGLQDVTKEIVRFDIDIEKHYRSMIQYYVISKLLKVFPDNEVLVIRAYEDILSALKIDYCKDKTVKGKSRICIYDDSRTNEEELIVDWMEDDLLICANSFEKYSLFENVIHENNLKNWRVIQIQKKAISSKCLGNIESEYIWIYSKNENKLKMLEKFKEEKKLSNTGITLNVEALTDDKEIQIKLLEGNLNAALLRIKKYKENEKSYTQRIVELENDLKNYEQKMLQKINNIILDEQKEK